MWLFNKGKPWCFLKKKTWWLQPYIMWLFRNWKKKSVWLLKISPTAILIASIVIFSNLKPPMLEVFSTWTITRDSERLHCSCDTVIYPPSKLFPHNTWQFARSLESPRRRRNNFRKWISKLLLWIGRKRGRRTPKRHNKMQFLKIQFSLNKYLDSMVNSNLGTSHSRVATDEWFLCESRHEKFIFHSAVRINFQFCTKINRLEPFDCQLSVSGDVFGRSGEGRWTRTRNVIHCILGTN